MLLIIANNPLVVGRPMHRWAAESQARRSVDRRVARFFFFLYLGIKHTFSRLGRAAELSSTLELIQEPLLLFPHRYSES